MVLLWIYLILILLSILDIINFHKGGSLTSIIIMLSLGHLYHKYKPMEFKELVKLIRDKLIKKE
jgi:hypothetical protein